MEEKRLKRGIRCLEDSFRSAAVPTGFACCYSVTDEIEFCPDWTFCLQNPGWSSVDVGRVHRRYYLVAWDKDEQERVCLLSRVIIKSFKIENHGNDGLHADNLNEALEDECLLMDAKLELQKQASSCFQEVNNLLAGRMPIDGYRPHPYVVNARSLEDLKSVIECFKDEFYTRKRDLGYCEEVGS